MLWLGDHYDKLLKTCPNRFGRDQLITEKKNVLGHGITIPQTIFPRNGRIGVS